MVKRVRVPKRYVKYMDNLERVDATGIYNFPEAAALNKILRKYEVDTIKCCPIRYNVFSLHRNGGSVKKTFEGALYSIYDVA